MKKESEKDINQEIIELTMEIRNNYPELEKYLEENPAAIPNQDKMDVGVLADYRNTLKTILRNYKDDEAGEHKDLSQRHCKPLAKGTKPLTTGEVELLLKELDRKWKVIDKSIRRELQFNDFKESIAFVEKLATLAEEEQHHPDITIQYSKVTLEMSTHDIGGLSENDFIMAAKINKL